MKSPNKFNYIRRTALEARSFLENDIYSREEAIIDMLCAIYPQMKKEDAANYACDLIFNCVTVAELDEVFGCIQQNYE